MLSDNLTYFSSKYKYFFTSEKDNSNLMVLYNNNTIQYQTKNAHAENTFSVGSTTELLVSGKLKQNLIQNSH